MGLNKNDKIENFTLTDSDGELISLEDLTGEGKTVLLFFPFAFSKTCTKEMCQTRDNMKLYNSLNVQVAGISVDSFYTLREFKKSNNLNFQLLSDFNKKVSRYFDCLYMDYYGMEGVSKRSVFVIDKDMKLIYSEILDDSSSLPDFKTVQRAIRH